MRNVTNQLISCLVSNDGLVKNVQTFEKHFNSVSGILHYGASKNISYEMNDLIHPKLPAFVRKVDVHNSNESLESFELWFHQNFKEQSDDQVAFYSPCEQSFIHYIDGVYFLFTVEGEVADKSIRYALSNDARPSYQKLKTNDAANCWQPLASGRVDSTLCLNGTLLPDARETFYFKMISALSEDELFSYYGELSCLDSFYSMLEINQHANQFETPPSSSIEPQSC
ncbi:hypothetical protein [Bacillus solimangrovi]|uniref:Uncharacterized protein n=1 Tax=Bacillus solimangrovi TaxID=1305675 RepID=A0A1E5LFQ1_9BACI|nr:hypothetical protein [Bacillus solimangrovi]OEH92909.1 hypothetical protein BFG57_14645 [Bacillus solimangrovi]